ncbi:hypothetical protein OE699_02040 [Sedimentimonas flavescens]|uniref:Uncharacterized protein n=1 Tax=Sedimentimonas flavescens TaxID=2851012 RepID=A0ABT2ZWD8_9RHOB|nr:hypothetical protein [Sedimentimonas flavescens]MCV2877620.1 hypothetical protein [Sedimentimonas flavescens]
MVVRLTWSPRVIADSQRIYRSDAPFTAETLPSPLDTISASASEYIDPTAEAGTDYWYAVAAVSGARIALSEVLAVTAAGSPPVYDPFTAEVGQVLALNIYKIPDDAVQVGQVLGLIIYKETA